MSKSEYSRYLASDHWQSFRQELLEENQWCAKCGLPRWLAAIAYRQDLNVHHKHYRTKGQETEEDVEPLCKRCHQVETFGASKLPVIEKFKCSSCEATHWNKHNEWCDTCELLFGQYRWYLTMLLSIDDLQFLSKEIQEAINHKNRPRSISSVRKTVRG